MAEDFPKLMMDIRPPVQEVQRTSSRINTNNTKRKESTPRPIPYKLQKTKDKEKNLQETIEKNKTKTKKQTKQKQQLTYIGTRIKIALNFSSENMQEESRIKHLVLRGR